MLINRAASTRKVLVWGAFLFLFQGLPVFAEDLHKFQFEQIRMGIPVKLTLYAPNEEVANKAADAAYARFRELDRLLSDYDPDSELMQLCQQAPGTPTRVSPELWHVLVKSQELSAETAGAFDITVGPLVKLWRIARRREQLPDAARLAAARERVGYEAVVLAPNQQTVTLQRPDMQLDLGAIAKGYAADEARRVMAEKGVTRVLIDAGGDLVLGDPPPERATWSVAIEPLRLGQSAETPVFLNLANCAVATSGDAYQHVEIAGVRYSHIIDPQTGLGLTNRGSVTVIASTGLTSDALASAVSVLGSEAGKNLVSRHRGCELFFLEICSPSTTPVITTTSGFADYIDERK